MTFQLGPATFTPPPAGASRTGHLEGFPISADVGSPFGPRPRTPELIAAGVTLDNHTGVDFPAPLRTPIVAPSSGIVFIANDMDDGTGFILQVRNGDWMWECYHLAEPARDYATGADLARGDFVRRGQVVGLVGSTGRSTGPHLHFAVMHLPTGQYRDPTLFFREHPAAEPSEFPALVRIEIAAALMEGRGAYTRDGEFGGGEIYKLTVLRDAMTGEVI
jgi:murein DD-endopeptidase MepM/ murein hydrolase activator NlpD